MIGCIPTAGRIREVLDYNPSTGEFRWKLAFNPRVSAGGIAGFVLNNRGWRVLNIDGHRYRTTFLAWLYVYGEWPTYGVEYRDGDRLNDRLANLIESRRDGEVTAERMRDLLDYDPDTGIFRWRIPVGQGRDSRRPGDVAGYLMPVGYRVITFDGHRLYAHRLAWLYVHGEWPPDEIDHENLDKDDNRIANLRPATRTDNLANQGARRDSLAGLKGIERSKGGRWTARICRDGKRTGLGTFDTPEAAHAAYVAAAKQIHGEFARAS